MKTYTLTLCLFFIALISRGQLGINSQWTWMKGDSTANSTGVYGTRGTAAAANKPAASEGSVSWKDASGNLWLFDGVLWKYELSTNQWTWVKGDHTLSNYGVYGNLGVAAPANQPGVRGVGVSWTDLAGNLWLFGGSGYAQSTSGLLNDLWKYSPATNEWAWMNGDSISDAAGVYGTQGIPDFTNKPGNKFGSVSWADPAGNFWLFGGRGYNEPGSPSLPHDFNELWKFNPTTNQWTYVRGSSGTGEYGTQGVASPANEPGSRNSSNSWVDGSGNLWLFGGITYYPISMVMNNYNDLWKYDPIMNQWTWMKGDNIPNTEGIYGTQGTADVANTPGSRFQSVTWTDPSGNLWLFGGDLNYMTFDGSFGSGIFSDLWKYDPLSNQWAWVKGDNNAYNFGVYGMQNISAAANKPGARYGAVSWVDNAGNLWLFGGNGYAKSEQGKLNDLWIFRNPSTVPVMLLDISATVEQKNVLVKWQTSQEINTSHFIVERSADGTNFISIGSVIAAGNSSSRRKYGYTDQRPLPGISYYRVKMADKDGLIKNSPVVMVTLDAARNITIYPNPVISIATINITAKANARLKFSLYDYKGSLVAAKQISIVAGNNSFAVDMGKLSKGTYTAVISWDNENKSVQLLKQ